jgi:hypothetical protein
MAYIDRDTDKGLFLYYDLELGEVDFLYLKKPKRCAVMINIFTNY